MLLKLTLLAAVATIAAGQISRHHLPNTQLGTLQPLFNDDHGHYSHLNIGQNQRHTTGLFQNQLRRTDQIGNRNAFRTSNLLGSNQFGATRFGTNQLRTDRFGTGQLRGSQFDANRINTIRLGSSQLNRHSVLGGTAQFQQHGLQQQPILAIHRVMNDNDGSGHYNFEYETENGIVRQESGGPVGLDSFAVSGFYSYTSPEGVAVSVSYVADENGFRVESPNVPPMPEHSRLQVLVAEEQRRLGLVDDSGLYHDNFGNLQSSNLQNLVNQNRNFVGANRNFVGANRNFVGANRNFVGANRNFVGANRNFVGANRNIGGLTSTGIHRESQFGLLGSRLNNQQELRRGFAGQSRLGFNSQRFNSQIGSDGRLITYN